MITLKPEPDLDKLGQAIIVHQVPDAAESEKYLSELHELKIRNAERDHLQLLDTIIELSERGEIGNNELKKGIPDSIVVIHREGQEASEYIHSHVTKKWIEYKFQTFRNELDVSIKTPHLVQISDKQKGIFECIRTTSFAHKQLHEKSYYPGLHCQKTRGASPNHHLL